MFSCLNPNGKQLGYLLTSRLESYVARRNSLTGHLHYIMHTQLNPQTTSGEIFTLCEHISTKMAIHTWASIVQTLLLM